MKALIISHMYPSSFNEVYGIFVHELAKALAKQNIEVCVVSPVPWVSFPINYFSSKWIAYSKIPYKAEIEGICVYYPRYFAFPHSVLFDSSGVRMYKGIKRAVGDIYNNFEFDLIHANVALPDGYAAMRLSKVYKKPFLVTIHGQDLQQTIFRDERCKKHVEDVINCSNRAVVVSNKLEEIAKKELKIHEEKISVIPNGVNDDTICTESLNFKQKYKGKKIVLSVSSLIKSKGIDLNIKAIAQLIKEHPNLIYLIVGDGAERKRLENLVYTLGIQDYIKFFGQLPHQVVMEYMSICDIFSLPSWNEAFGVVYVEAMAYGKPVIGCEGEGINGIIVHGRNGMLVKPRNVDSIVEAIDYLLSHPEEANAMGERAQKLVLENYTWKKVADKTITIYKEILNNV